ncbi:regulator of telomere elongation helicase 1-like [Elysia marginata]|uniref:Regulator of telomere elongation helicase 1 homolog n=1 Tax=Elysia marginata TaxID=1093978 RepID=A0AAV4HTX7_9GAST|nr:regulator of telomere elongation helicase 1-like [Elysia marginata]
MARELKSDADIVFLPYNYLLDSKSRKTHGVELQGSIIIFDEAHNLEKICEESASFDLSSLDLATAIEETSKLAEKLSEMSGTEMEFSQVEDSAIIPEFTLEDVIRLKKTLLDLEEHLDQVEISNSQPGRTLPGVFIFELLSKVNINWTTKNDLLDKLDKMNTFLSNDDGHATLNTKGAALGKFSDCLKIVFCQEPADGQLLYSHQQNISQHFKVHIQTKKGDSKFKKNIDAWSTTSNAEKKERTLSYWCFSPGHTMKDLLAHGVKVIILTSGTLSPLDSFAKEMQIPFPVQLENPHVIEPGQVWLGTVCKGPDGATLNSDYKNRSTDEYKKSLGNTITNFARIVPNGLLVFFPSYPVMEGCIETWKSSNQWTIISQYKPVIVEPKGKTAFTEAIDEFYTKMNDQTLNGAIFMAVCRGKVSEGLDFADANGRAVMITGLPFPPRFDPRIQLKMDFLQENRDKFKGLDGNTWYRQQATRAVNQAIGRVIRHNKDYGAIILCDTRFSSAESKKSLPLWVRDQSKVYANFGLAVRDVIKFFKEAEKNYPCLAPKQHKPSRQVDGGIVTGVCFEPSFSKRSHDRDHINIQYEQASAVACHMPSLKEGDVNTVYSQYSHSNRSVLSRKRSLLEALDSSEESSQEPSRSESMMEENMNLFSQKSSFKPPLKKLPGKQKRIKIKPSSSNSTSETENLERPGSSEEVSAKSDSSSKQSVIKEKSKQALSSSQDYVNEVRKALSKDQYREFSDVLHSYRKENKIETVLPVLTELFTKSMELHPLFQKFYRFVRPDHKVLYAQKCFKLTGLSCSNGFSGSDSKADTSRSEVQQKPSSSSAAITMNIESNTTVARVNSTSTPDELIKCIACHQPPQKGLRHECGAVACLTCWVTKVFQVSPDRKCLKPDCDVRIKRKHLQPISSNPGS